MDFGIEIRNVDTGRAETLHGKQAVADFLAAHPGETWEGYKCLGELPAPTPAVSDKQDAPLAADHSDTPLMVGDTFADQAVSVVDAGKGDTYLPVDQGAQS